MLTLLIKFAEYKNFDYTKEKFEVFFLMSSKKGKSGKRVRTQSISEKEKGGNSSQGILNAKQILGSLKDKAQQLQKLSSSKIGVPEGWRRVTVIMREDYYEQLKELSYREKIPIKNIVDAILESFLSSVEVQSLSD